MTGPELVVPKIGLGGVPYAWNTATRHYFLHVHPRGGKRAVNAPANLPLSYDGSYFGSGWATMAAAGGYVEWRVGPMESGIWRIQAYMVGQTTGGTVEAFLNGVSSGTVLSSSGTPSAGIVQNDTWPLLSDSNENILKLINNHATAVTYLSCASLDWISAT